LAPVKTTKMLSSKESREYVSRKPPETITAGQWKYNKLYLLKINDTRMCAVINFKHPMFSA
jgi:hypothetical protein